MPQMRDVQAAHIVELDAFELLPEALPRVQLRGIGRQAFEMEALRCAAPEKLFNDVAAVNRRAIPDDDHLSGHLAQQVLQEGDHIRRVEGVILTLEIEFALRREGTDGREVVTGPPFLQGRGLADRRIGPHHTRQGIKARFV